MVRKSTRQSAASAPRSSSKRPAPAKTTPTRQSKRTKATSARSAYFEDDSEDEENGSAFLSEGGGDTRNESGYEEHASSNGSPTSESDNEVVSSEEDLMPPKKGKRAISKKEIVAKVHGGAKDKELWRPGAKLPPGTQLIIKKPKAREAGAVPYGDNTIHPNTMLFLKDLAANNDREWLKMHDPDYRVSLKDFGSFVECLTQKVIEADETIPELPVKDIIFRIYRDIRFTSDPTPYKTHFSAAWSRTGRKGPYAAYYVQIAPGKSFVGGGLWCPAAEPLSLLRRDIDRNPHKIKRVLTDVGIRKAFFGGVADDEKKAVQAFVSQNAENALKTKPKGYETDHPDIDLLRLRNYTIGRQLADDEVIGARGLDHIAEQISCMVPFITYLNSVVMPDEGSNTSSDEDEDGESGGVEEG